MAQLSLPTMQRPATLKENPPPMEETPPKRLCEVCGEPSTHWLTVEEDSRLANVKHMRLCDSCSDEIIGMLRDAGKLIADRKERMRDRFS
jgi:hypothetical protein